MGSSINILLLNRYDNPIILILYFKIIWDVTTKILFYRNINLFPFRHLRRLLSGA